MLLTLSTFFTPLASPKRGRWRRFWTSKLLSRVTWTSAVVKVSSDHSEVFEKMEWTMRRVWEEVVFFWYLQELLRLLGLFISKSLEHTISMGILVF